MAAASNPLIEFSFGRADSMDRHIKEELRKLFELAGINIPIPMFSKDNRAGFLIYLIYLQDRFQQSLAIEDKVQHSQGDMDDQIVELQSEIEGFKENRTALIDKNLRLQKELIEVKARLICMAPDGGRKHTEHRSGRDIIQESDSKEEDPTGCSSDITKEESVIGTEDLTDLLHGLGQQDSVHDQSTAHQEYQRQAQNFHRRIKRTARVWQWLEELPTPPGDAILLQTVSAPLSALYRPLNAEEVFRPVSLPIGSPIPKLIISPTHAPSPGPPYRPSYSPANPFLSVLAYRAPKPRTFAPTNKPRSGATSLPRQDDSPSDLAQGSQLPCSGISEVMVSKGYPPSFPD